MIDVVCGKLLICISVFLLCGGLYLFSLRRCAGLTLLVGAVAMGAWSVVSIFGGLELFTLFAQLFVGGVLVGAEVALIVVALRSRGAGVEDVEETEEIEQTDDDDDEIIDFGFDPSDDDVAEQEGAEVDSAPMDASVGAWIESKRYLDSGVTIVNMAAELKTNRTYLSTYINKHYGVSFRDWLTALRIEDAKALLQDQSLSVADIALRTGFATATTFSRSFARMESVTPTEWRNK